MESLDDSHMSVFLSDIQNMADIHLVNSNIKFIDLFAGIGGFHLALHNLGATCVFASELDKNARKTYIHNFQSISPDLFRQNNFAGDITGVKNSEIPDFDILCAGFPCQPFSQAGYKKGFDEVRGTLFFDIVKIIQEKKPAAFFLENVRHLLNHDEGKTFAIIRKILEDELDYSFYHSIVKASDFGLPQHRPRLFMVGFKNRKLKFEFPKPIPLKKTMSDILGGECDRKIGFTLRVGGKGSSIEDRRNWDSYRVDGTVKRIDSEHGKAMQGFPSNFEFPVSKVQAMKQLGNSVAVPAIQAVAASIIKTLGSQKKC